MYIFNQNQLRPLQVEGVGREEIIGGIVENYELPLKIRRGFPKRNFRWQVNAVWSIGYLIG